MGMCIPANGETTIIHSAVQAIALSRIYTVEARTILHLQQVEFGCNQLRS